MRGSADVGTKSTVVKRRDDCAWTATTLRQKASSRDDVHVRSFNLFRDKTLVK